jgi:serine/threonine-protein phosphatase 2A regulatory subunit A
MSFDILSFFKAEITANDLRDRLTCVAGLDAVAAALGADHTAAQVLPVLTDYVAAKLGFEDEEVPLAIAKKLPSLTKTVPACALAPLLELIATLDETVLRDAAVVSLGALGAQEGSEFTFAYLLPLITRLFNDSWFSAKISACGLLSAVYPLVPPASQAELRRLYLAAFDDETPMVRRAAGLKLPEVLKVVKQDHVLLEFLPGLKRMATDETQEMLRLSSLQCCAILAEKCRGAKGTGDVVTLLRSLVAALAKDKSWRVRMVVARNFVSFCASFGDEVARADLLPVLIAFLKDAEVDVRQTATQTLGSCLSFFTKQQVCTLILPEVIFVAADVSPVVRSACAEILPALLTEVGEDDEGSEESSPRAAVISLVQEAFRDENYAVRVAVVQVSPLLCRALGANDARDIMIPLVAGIACDQQWRVKIATTERLPAIAGLFGVETFDAHLQSVYVAAFADTVYAVREEAIARIPELTSELGKAWLTDKLWPKLSELFSPNQSYLNRMTVLHSMRKVAPYFSAELIERSLLPILIQAFNDPVANVQLCACTTLQSLQPLIPQPLLKAPQLIVQQLVASKDKDVCWLAKDTIAKLAA